MSSRQTVLVVALDSATRSKMIADLVAQGFRVRATNAPEEAWRIFQAETIAAVFMDEGCVGVGEELAS